MKLGNKSTDITNGSTLRQAYLEGLAASEAEHRQIEKIIAEANATEHLKCYFKNNRILRRARTSYERLSQKEKLNVNSFADYIEQLPIEDTWQQNVHRYNTELTRRFNVLEKFVLTPVELENTRQLGHEHIAVRFDSIEMLEKVLELITVKSEMLC